MMIATLLNRMFLSTTNISAVTKRFFNEDIGSVEVVLSIIVFLLLIWYTIYVIRDTMKNGGLQNKD